MTTSPSRLDADELLHLAIVALNEDQHESAIDYLKRAIEANPSHAKSHYMLAAEHAQLGLYDRAVEGMQKAVDLDPDLHTAHFQLGLLHLTSGRVKEATQAWEPLNALGEENPLYLFKSGLEALAADRFDECRAYLTQGMSRNASNPQLNGDMQRILDQLPTSEPNDSTPSETGHVFLSAYSNEDRDN